MATCMNTDKALNRWSEISDRSEDSDSETEGSVESEQSESETESELPMKS